LHLAGVVAGAYDEEVGESGNFAKVQNSDVFGLLGLGGSDGNQPRGFDVFQFIGLTQGIAPVRIVLQ
jgi:hypothetical protein